MKKRKQSLVVIGSSIATLMVIASACGSTSSSLTSQKGADWATATSASEGGGMKALVKAAEKEGQLNVIALPDGWANYGEIMSSFQKKYHIHITDYNPDGSSSEELTSITNDKGTSKEPDVVDVGPSFALVGAKQGLFAPYKVAAWNNIPADSKAANGDWYFDYGGYESIGYNAADFRSDPPTSFASLLKPEFKGAVALDGNPTSAGAAFGAVYAAAIANGGSFSNIAPGLSYFHRLVAAGNFVPVLSTAAAIESGQERVAIDWDYLAVAEAQEVKGKVDWKVFVPASGHYASYYAQAISKYAPDPAAARLWEEYLYSAKGQNLWLKGYASPIELAAMEKNGTVNKAYLAKIPNVKGVPTFPTQAQLAKASALVISQWPSITSK